MEQEIKGSDLRKLGVYEQFKKECADKNLPIPPAHLIEKGGHHWLEHRPPFNGPIELMVAQWSPGSLKWYRSNEMATAQSPIYLEHWHWIAHIPEPDLSAR